MAEQPSSRMTSPEKELRANRRAQIVASLASKPDRDAFVRQQIETGMPFQIRAMRNSQDMSQQALAALLDKPQSVISRLEDPRYGRYTINTLLQVASAFDVGLLVTFAPFSALVDRALGTSFFAGSVVRYSSDVMLSPKGDLSGSNISMITTDDEAVNVTKDTAGKSVCWVNENSGDFQMQVTGEAIPEGAIRYG